MSDLIKNNNDTTRRHQQNRASSAPDLAADAELMALQAELHEAAQTADQAFKDMGDYATLEEELAVIDAIMAPGDALVERMFALPPATSAGVDARVRAGAWHTGDYITTYLRPDV